MRASALLVGLTAISQLLGFVRDAVIAAVFGIGADIDAYLVAQGLMNLVLALVAGAMAKAVVPPVARAADNDEPERAHRTTRVALTVVVAVLVAGSAVMYVAAGAVVAVLAPGFDAQTAETAESVTRIVLVATVFIAGTNVLAAAAQAHGRFFWAGIQGVPFNLVMIAAAALFGAEYGVAALAVGFVIGSAARFLVQLPAVRQIGLRLRPSFAVRDPDFVEAVRLVPALLLGSAIANINTLVDRAVGSAQGAGTIASLNYGWRIVNLAETLLIVAFLAALFPAFSTLGTPERRAELRSGIGRTLGVVLVVMAPAAVMLAVAAEPIVEVAFGRGAFGEDAVALTSLAVAAYAFALVGLAVREVAARACLAVGDSRTPVRIAVVALAINVVGDLTFGIWFGVVGLAASTTASIIFAAVAMCVALRRRHDALALGPLASTLGKVVVAAVAAGGSVWLMLRLVSLDGSLGALAEVAVSGSVCVLVYVLGLVALRVPALKDVRQAITDLRRHS